MKNHKFEKACSVISFVLATLVSAVTVVGQAQTGTLSQADSDKIIASFTHKEAEFRRALNQYSFKRDALIQSIGMGGQVVGEYHKVSTFTFDDQGNRYEKIIFFPMDEGWTRYVFDTFNVPYESIKDTDVKGGNLKSKYDVVLLPSQRSREIIDGNAAGTLPAEYTGGIGEGGVANLKEFVNNGGTLICFDAACELPIKQFSLPLTNVIEGLRSSDFYCPGSIVSLDLDNRNPITSTLPVNLPAYFINSSAFSTTDANVRVVARYAKDNVLRSGWLLGEDKLRGQIALAEVRLGKGRVVLFAFRPQHRGQTWGTLPLLWNSIATSAK